MRGLMLAGGATLLGGGAYIGGAFDQSEYYSMAPADVEARLAGLQLGDESGSNFRLVLRSRGPALVRWDLMDGSTRMADVRASLAPDDTGTRVAVNFEFKEGEALMGLEEDPFLNEVAEIAMIEKIDSTLEGRAFNVDIVHARMAASIAANPQAVANMQHSIQQNVAKELREIDAGDFSGGAGGVYGAGPSGAPRAGKPLPPPNFSESHADGGWGKN